MGCKVLCLPQEPLRTKLWPHTQVDVNNGESLTCKESLGGYIKISGFYSKRQESMNGFQKNH